MMMPSLEVQNNQQENGNIDNKENVFLELPLSIKNMNKQGQLLNSSQGGDQECNYARVVPFIPENATEKEQKIHSFLNQFNVFAVNIKEMIEDFSKTPTSNRLRQEFGKKKMNSSLFERRKNQQLSFSSQRTSPFRIDKPQFNSGFEDQLEFGRKATQDDKLGLSFGLALTGKRRQIVDTFSNISTHQDDSLPISNDKDDSMQCF
ncbi:UNKNOWN [Stylonychia lemnae]|uniref:Uncharacterized protein n=1 Tax=Stylonychia lemnae TaxID=5949 RepID=A0A078B6L9_STYLE|nr:UNKNOWN [Stylonychia lemnae]|eukprot:CDW89866.1 UNKNOWN [Stylonychia lemnae]